MARCLRRRARLASYLGVLVLALLVSGPTLAQDGEWRRGVATVPGAECRRHLAGARCVP